jgi:hypothetical protein
VLEAECCHIYLVPQHCNFMLVNFMYFTGYRLDGPGIEYRWGRKKFFAPVQTGPEAHPASCTTDTGSFPGVKSGQGVTLSPHPLLVPWSRKTRAIPLLPLWAVRPVQSLSACTRGKLYLTMWRTHIMYLRRLEITMKKFQLGCTAHPLIKKYE